MRTHWRIAGLGLLAAALSALTLAAPAAAEPVCSRYDYVYEGPPGEWSAPRITLSAAAFEAIPEDASRSPGIGAALWTENPDMTASGEPRSARVMAAMEGGRGLRLDLKEVLWGVEPVWINEKLIYLRVVWGRIFFTDLILNVETAAIVYAMDVRWSCVE